MCIPVPLEDAGFSWNYKRLVGKALIEENSYSIVEINNAAQSVYKTAICGKLSKPYSSLHLFLRTLHGWCC
jgi:hypothetical protein